MKTRILSAAVAIFLLICLLAGSLRLPWLISLLFAAIGAIAAFEMARTTGFLQKRKVWIAGILLTALVPAAEWAGTDFPLTETLFLLYVLFMFVVKLLHFEEIRLPDLLTCGGMTVFLTYSLNSINRLWIQNDCGSQAMFLVVLSMAMAWFADTGAYFVGVSCGKHKLCPKISPKKTVEGLIGGIASCILLTGVSALIYTKGVNPSVSVSWLGVILVAGICSVVSVVGDLIFSAVKRQYNIKDYGNIMPGHGGVLDRFDSVLLVAPVFGMFLQYLPIIHA